MRTYLTALLRNSSIYVFGVFLQRGALLLLVPLYVRYLTPDEYGTLGLATVLMSLGKILLSFGLQSAAFRFFFIYKDESERRRFYGTIWIFILLGSGLITLILDALFLRGEISPFAQIPYDPYIRFALWISYLRASFELIPLEIFRAQERALPYVGMSLLTFLATMTLQIVFVSVLGIGLIGVFLGELFASFLLSAVVGILMARYISIRVSPKYLKVSFDFSLPLLPHLVANWVLNLSDRWILERFVPLASLGIYSLADQIRQAFGVFSWGVNSAMMPTFGKAATDPDERKRIPGLSTYFILAMTLLGAMVIVFSPELLQALAAPQYFEASRYVPLLIVGAFFRAVYFIPTNIQAQIIGKTASISIVTVTSAAVTIALNLLTIPIFGLFAAAMNTAIGYGLLLFLMYISSRKEIHIPFEAHRIRAVLAAAVFVTGVGLLIHTGSLGWNIVLKSITVGIFPLVLLIFRFPNAREKAILADIIPGYGGRGRNEQP